MKLSFHTPCAVLPEQTMYRALPSGGASLLDKTLSANKLQKKPEPSKNLASQDIPQGRNDCVLRHIVLKAAQRTLGADVCQCLAYEQT
jgi:hypothetical protein